MVTLETWELTNRQQIKNEAIYDQFQVMTSGKVVCIMCLFSAYIQI